MRAPFSSSRRLNRTTDSGIAPLKVCITRTVRFEEVDAMQYMWHGRYASWLEDGRDALGTAYSLNYLDFFQHGVSIPLKLFHLDFHQPLRYGQTYSIHASLLWNAAAALDFEYTLMDNEGIVTTTGYTTQLMLSLDGKLLLEQPAFYKEFCEKWRQAGQACSP